MAALLLRRDILLPADARAAGEIGTRAMRLTLRVLRYALSLPVRVLLTVCGVFWWSYGAPVDFRAIWTPPGGRFGT